jgi:hypothetical protein
MVSRNGICVTTMVKISAALAGGYAGSLVVDSSLATALLARAGRG